MIMIDPAGWAAIGALGGAIVTAISTVAAMRNRKAPDMQIALAQGVADVIKHYTQALEDMREETRKLSQHIEEQNCKIDDLEEHIDVLTTTMQARGIPAPPRRRKKCAAE